MPEELIDGIPVDLSRLPEKFHPLIPYMREWYIGDDVDRSDKQEATSTEELQALFDAVWPLIHEIDAYLIPRLDNSDTVYEDIILGGLGECAAEVRFELERRLEKDPAA